MSNILPHSQCHAPTPSATFSLGRRWSRTTSLHLPAQISCSSSRPPSAKSSKSNMQTKAVTFTPSSPSRTASSATLQSSTSTDEAPTSRQFGTEAPTSMQDVTTSARGTALRRKSTLPRRTRPSSATTTLPLNYEELPRPSSKPPPRYLGEILSETAARNKNFLTESEPTLHESGCSATTRSSPTPPSGTIVRRRSSRTPTLRKRLSAFLMRLMPGSKSVGSG